MESRCTMADLQARVVGHSCLVCNTHTSILLLIPPTLKEKNQEKSNNVEFPPAPLDANLSHKIIAS